MRRGLLTAMLLIAGVLASAGPAATEECVPTRPDQLGPYYKPDAPVRSSVGNGYVLTGVVRSATDCAPVPGARIEIWLAGPEGAYDDGHRATVLADRFGAYWFQSNVPPPYFGRPPHIHLRVSAKGFATLVTQHYPDHNASSAAVDLVLEPSP